jgi:predicted ATPase with chaperone activity
VAVAVMINPVNRSFVVSSTSLQPNLANSSGMATVAVTNVDGSTAFFPRAPETLNEAGLFETDVESLILKSLFTAGAATGRTLADQMRLPGSLVRATLDRLRAELLVAHKGTADLVDFVFQLTEVGAQRAKQYALNNTYCGSAPVPLESYVKSVKAQTIRNRPLNLERFRKALSGIYLDRDTVNELAQAVNAGRGLFLFGSPGNGKTTVAERIARSFDDYLWIPRAVSVGGEIIRLFDSSVHTEVEPQRLGADMNFDQLDRRWALIMRPTIVVGGELMMEHLEIGQKHGTTVLEAPVQMKANGGVLVIDDFGRQRVSPTDILNRWIVPLDRGRDYLSLPNGRQITVPFDQILVMATNLEPRELVDEAFLRRIPFKIELPNPDQKAFTDVFLAVARAMKIECHRADVERLLETHYRDMNIAPRFCQPRDLLFHIGNICALHNIPRRVTDETMGLAVKNYFSGMYGCASASSDSNSALTNNGNTAVASANTSA